MNDNQDINERMEIWEKRKNDKIKELKTEIELKKEEACTFTPKINQLNDKVLKSYPSNISGSEFQRSGLQSYFQRKENARYFHIDSSMLIKI